VGVILEKLSWQSMLKETGSLPENVNYALKIGYLRELLSYVPTRVRASELPRTGPASVADIAERVEKAVVLILAE
jgi:hypothetical protein